MSERTMSSRVNSITGTGKTWIAATHAADLFRNGFIDKIILTRPNLSLIHI